MSLSDKSEVNRIRSLSANALKLMNTLEARKSLEFSEALSKLVWGTQY